MYSYLNKLYNESYNKLKEDYLLLQSRHEGALLKIKELQKRLLEAKIL